MSRYDVYRLVAVVLVFVAITLINWATRRELRERERELARAYAQLSRQETQISLLRYRDYVKLMTTEDAQ